MHCLRRLLSGNGLDIGLFESQVDAVVSTWHLMNRSLLNTQIPWLTPISPSYRLPYRSQRAFLLNRMHELSCIYIGVFNHNIGPLRHTGCGRITVDLRDFKVSSHISSFSSYLGIVLTMISLAQYVLYFEVWIVFISHHDQPESEFVDLFLCLNNIIFHSMHITIRHTYFFIHLVKGLHHNSVRTHWRNQTRCDAIDYQTASTTCKCKKKEDVSYRKIHYLWEV